MKEKAQEWIADLHFFRSGKFTDLIRNGRSLVFLDPALHQSQQHSHEQLEPDPDTQKQDEFLSITLNWEIAFKTSGSMGEPKLFYKSRENISSEVDFLSNFLLQFLHGTLFHPLFLVSVPLCHIYGFLWGYALPLQLGAKIIDCLSLSAIRKEIKKIDDLKNNFRSSQDTINQADTSKPPFTPKIWITIPAQLDAVIEASNPNTLSLVDWTIIVSGSRMDGKKALAIQEKFSCRIIEIYGSTETGGMGYRIPAKSDIIHLFDCVQAELVEDQLAIRSPFLHPHLPRNENDFFITEDTGELDGKNFQYTGRIGRIIKKKGKRIHLDGVESALREVPGITEAIAVALDMGSGDPKIAALIQGRPKKEDWYSLPKFLIPDIVEFTDELPKLSNGKKDYIATQKVLSPASSKIAEG